LADVSVRAFNSAPGGAGVEGYLRLTESEGLVEFRAADVSLNFPDLFPQGWTFAQAEGSVTWPSFDDATQVHGRGLKALLSDRQGEVRGGFHLLIGDDPVADRIEDHLALSLGFREVHAHQVQPFLPCLIIKQSICEWVGGNLKAGRISQGAYLYNGSIEDGPGEQDFVSRLFLTMEEGELTSAPAWPAAQNVAATLLLDGSSLDIAVHRGSLAGTSVDGARIWTPPASAADGPAVHAKLSADLATPQLDYWLKQSPLRDHIGE